MDSEDDPGPAVGLTGARFGGAPRRRRAARQRADEQPPQGGGSSPAPTARPTGDADTVAIPVVPAVHHPGARAHGAPGAEPAGGTGPAQWGPPGPNPPALAQPAGAQPAGAQPAGAQPGAPPGDAGPGRDGPAAAAGGQEDGPEGPVVGATGARFGGARRRKRPAAGAPAPQPVAGAPSPDPQPHDPPPDAGEPGADEPTGGSSFVRPYVFTRGRTRSSFQLSIETLVSAASQAPSGTGLTGEHQVVLDLCREPRSVAELAAGAGVPLGVARVLVGDLAGAGAVAVHRSAGEEGPDLALMQRVLSGLRRL